MEPPGGAPAAGAPRWLDLPPAVHETPTPAAPSTPLKGLAAQTADAFTRRFHAPPAALAAAPGRVNLIGEHVDYNGGWVLPAAIERWIVAAAVARDDGVVALHDARSGETARFGVAELRRPPRRCWSNYVRGVLAGFAAAGLRPPGLALTITSTIPLGGGLSSSAALEAVVARVVCRLFGWEIGPLQLAKLCQQAEHDFAGVPCGLMDQAAVLLSREGHFLLLDCATEAVAHVPFAQPDWRILVINSGVAHALADGEYARRRTACHQAAAALGLTSLRELDPSCLPRAGRILTGEMNRCVRHVVTENQRTLDTVAALNRGDLAEVGRLLNASHASLRDDFRVSCAELDFIAATAQRIEGVAGCRMTGGGFGGSAVALVQRAALDTASTAISAAFAGEFGRPPALFSTRPAEGAAAWADWTEVPK
jgi:galactokinase